MRTVLAVLATLLIGGWSSPITRDADAYTDPLCLGDMKNLWLDIVVVVDKSQLMTNAQLWQVRNTISQVFGTGTRIGPTKYPADPRSSCVGVVTYDENATTNAQIDGPKSFTDLYNVIQGSLVSVDNTNTSYLSRGLLAAEQAFKDGRDRTYRFHFKKVIIAFAADYQGVGTALDAKPVANRLKNNEVTIITVACTSDRKVVSELESIASPGYNFIDEMNTGKLVKQLTNALLSANCYCPDEWFQYRSDYKNETSTKYGICVKGFKATGGNYGYGYASTYCDYDTKTAFLVAEFNKQKHDFVVGKFFFPSMVFEFDVLAYMEDNNKYVKPLEYYIGLRYLNNQWVWEQPIGQKRLSFDLNGYSNWAPGYPQKNSTDQVIANQLWTNTSTEYVWAPPQTFDWMFVCQVQSSSTEYYTSY